MNPFPSLTKTAFDETLDRVRGFAPDAVRIDERQKLAVDVPTLGGQAHKAWEGVKGLFGYALNPRAAQLQAQNQNLQEQMHRAVPAALIGGGLAGAALMAHIAQKKREQQAGVEQPKVAATTISGVAFPGMAMVGRPLPAGPVAQQAGPVKPPNTGGLPGSDAPGAGGLMAARLRQLVTNHPAAAAGVAAGGALVGGGLLGAAFARHRHKK